MANSQQKKIVSLNPSERETLLSRAAESTLDASDVERIREVFESYAYLSVLIHNKETSIARLRKILFGDSSEASAKVLGTEQGGTKEANASSAAAAAADSGAASSPPDKTHRGHGRNGAQDLPGAKRVSVRIAELQPGAECPACGTGPLYELNEPGVLIRFVGNAPVRATIYELQKLRCQLCGKVFTADADRPWAQALAITGARIVAVRVHREPAGPPDAPPSSYVDVDFAYQKIEYASVGGSGPVSASLSASCCSGSFKASVPHRSSEFWPPHAPIMAHASSGRPWPCLSYWPWSAARWLPFRSTG